MAEMELPDTLEYEAAFRQLSNVAPWTYRRMLAVQYRAENRTVTPSMLIHAADTHDGKGVRLRYGSLAGEVGRTLGRPKPKGRPWIWLLSEVIPSKEKRGEPEWRMHAPVAEALEGAGWVPRQPRTESEAIQHSLDQLSRLALYIADQVDFLHIEVRATQREVEKIREEKNPHAVHFLRHKRRQDFERITDFQSGYEKRTANRLGADLLLDHWSGTPIDELLPFRSGVFSSVPAPGHLNSNDDRTSGSGNREAASNPDRERG